MPQSDGIFKRRPALILKVMPPFGDFLICGLSSNLLQRAEGFDEIISSNDPDFKLSKLKVPSLIRLGWLETASRSTFKGVVGAISDERLHRLVDRLSVYLTH